jgi:Na+-driven multidrug efflux pump
MVVTSTIVHIILSFLFYYVFEMGFFGVCLATLFQNLIKVFVAYFYVKYTPEFQNVYGTRVFSWESTENLWNQFSGGVGYTLMMAQGWWSFDVLTLMATYLGQVSQ